MYSKSKIILVTGGAGFIGSHFVRYLIKKTDYAVANVDKLTYSGSKKNIRDLLNDKKHFFIKGDISNIQTLKNIFKKFQPSYIVNFAAETHVDNSIRSSYPFIKNNILGTYHLLNFSKIYWSKLSKEKKKKFKFIQISTDEVFGQLSLKDPSFHENSRYDPSSPYSASKASADHIVRSFYKTYNFPINITNCSNNFGPNQHKEKLIPLVINNILKKKIIPVYGKGLQIRDWLYVEDHISAIWRVLKKGKIGETYLIGGKSEKKNIDVVMMICKILDTLYPLKQFSYKNLIKFVSDRPGHDFRYSINKTKIQKKLNWKPKHKFEDSLKHTVKWYLKEFLD